MPTLLERLRRRSRRVAFVLSGGGNLGAVQVGMLRALAEEGIRPHVVLGASVGALNGAAFAAEPTVHGVAKLEQTWLGLRGKDDVMPAGSWLPLSAQLLRRGASVHPNDGLRRVIDTSLGPRERFEDLELAFECVATEIAGAREVWFASGDRLKQAILASAALPAIYPLVEIDGVRYLDGAVVDDVPIARAVELGARQVYVLTVGSLDRPWLEPRRPLDMAIQAYWIARRHRYRRDLAEVPRRVRVDVLPTGDPPSIRIDDFSQSAALIEAAYQASRRHLRGEGGPLDAAPRPAQVPAPTVELPPAPPTPDEDEPVGAPPMPPEAGGGS